MNKLYLFRKLPDVPFYVAWSGGADSATLLHLAVEKGLDVSIAYFDHDTFMSDSERKLLEWTMQRYSIRSVATEKFKGTDMTGGMEASWRRERYKFFHSLSAPVVLGHHLNDVAEWYLISCMRGKGKWMSYRDRSNCVRPALATTKAEILEYAMQNGVRWVDDPTNIDGSNLRSAIRSSGLIEKIIQVEPGFLSMCRRNVLEFNKDQT